MAQALTKNFLAVVLVLSLGLAGSFSAKADAGTAIGGAALEENSGPLAMMEKSFNTPGNDESLDGSEKAFLFGRPFWRPYWFLDGKILLYYAPIWTYSHTGFWGGWYPYYYHNYYYYPWYGPVFCHPCCWNLNWHYWWWQWPWRNNCYYSNYWYQGCWWWWHPWQGGTYFYGFLDRLQYRYWYPYPRTTYWWSWYWCFNGRVYCMEVVTLGDAQDGGRVLPLDNAVLDNLEVSEHTFSVNGGKVQGSFLSQSGEPLDRVPVNALPEYYAMLGANPEDMASFMESDIYQNLLSHSLPGDQVLVQYAEFIIEDNGYAEISFLQSDDGNAMEITEGEQASYEITLAAVPEADVFVTVTPSVNAEKIDLGAGPGVPVVLHFPAGDPGPRAVNVQVLDNDVQNRHELAVLTHTVESLGPLKAGVEIPAVPIAIKDNECGSKGYLFGDVNRDCNVNFLDVVIIADDWVSCTDPSRPECVAAPGY